MQVFNVINTFCIQQYLHIADFDRETENLVLQRLLLKFCFIKEKLYNISVKLIF